LFLKQSIFFGLADGLLTLMLVDVQRPLCSSRFSVP
jgi:hypothetical protein